MLNKDLYSKTRYLILSFLFVHRYNYSFNNTFAYGITFKQDTVFAPLISQASEFFLQPPADILEESYLYLQNSWIIKGLPNPLYVIHIHSLKVFLNGVDSQHRALDYLQKLVK